MKTRLLLAVIAAISLFASLAGPAMADGMVIVNNAATGVVGPPMPPGPPFILPSYLSVKYHNVQVTIKDQVAQTRVDQVFVNDTDRELEGTYIFPLPDDAAISGFSMFIDGKKLEGALLTREEARRIYEETVSRKHDPALLEYVGRGAFQARVYPIPAHAERRIQIEYTQALAMDGGLVRYVYPLSTEKLSPKPLQQLAIDVSISGRQAIKAIYSSSHDVAVSRQGDYSALASYEASNVRPDRDFVLYFGVAQSEIGANLLTYRQGNDDGYFMLLVSPSVEVDASKVAAKDIILVLDVSGSMQGEKLAQAKGALRFVLERLNPDDRFALITFNTSINRFREGLLGARDREAALRFVDGISAGGSTNINDALLESLKGVDPERPTVLIFLTDGLPTTGVTDAARIVDNVARSAPRSVRLFSFGVGYDVNTTLLDTLAANQRGASAYVKPAENLEDAVSGFYARISKPVLTDIALDFGSVRVGDLYPAPLPDIFVGSQLVLVGRYRSNGATTITLKGTVNGQPQQFSYGNVSFPAQTGGDTAFIARLWATRRVGYLLTQIKLNGSNKELVDEIVSLSTRYGIITPYTSFLVDERQNVLSAAGQQKAVESLIGRGAPAAAPTAGAAAVQDSQALRQLREAPSSAAVTQSTQMRTVGDKTFLQRNGVWIDTQYRDDMKTADLGFGSSDYFALLAARPEWGKYFALGDKVIVLLDSVAYRVGEGTFAPIAIPATPAPTHVEPLQPNPLSFVEQIRQLILSLLGR